MKIAIALLFVSALAVACPSGYVSYQGLCSADPKPSEGGMFVPEVKPSDEKVPADKMPSYQREGIHADIDTKPETAESERAKQVAHDAKAEKDLK
jgi:hypothetical protein